MNKDILFNKLNKLDLDKDKYIILSGASLVAQGIIDSTEDIDLACSKSFYDTIDWPVKMGDAGVEIKYNDIFEISYNLYDEESYIIIDGYKFMNLEACLDVKRKLNRSKDRKIITKLDLLLGSSDNTRYERKLNKLGYKLIAGIDEVGRGPLVGPVVAACVILPVDYKLDGLTDSKKLSEKKREELYPIIIRDAIGVGIGEASSKEIDEVNIYEASKLAMVRAVNNLNIKPDYLLIDAMKLDLDINQLSIIKGDFLSQSIAAASVVAKVTRDHMMIDLDKKYPEYGFSKHKGYPTKLHLDALKKYGPLENYRFTYGPVRDLINDGGCKNESNNK